jgi:hypothetical protein
MQSSSDHLLNQLLTEQVAVREPVVVREQGADEGDDSEGDEGDEEDEEDEGDEGDVLVSNRKHEIIPTGVMCSLKTQPIIHVHTDPNQRLWLIASPADCSFECYEQDPRRCSG